MVCDLRSCDSEGANAACAKKPTVADINDTETTIDQNDPLEEADVKVFPDFEAEETGSPDAIKRAIARF
jgi:hypothetical protein